VAPFRVLHISDIHFGPHCQVAMVDPKDTGRNVADLLLSDLSAHRFNLRFHAVIASGDFTWENRLEEFAAADSFLRQLSHRLDVPLSDFVVIPGNHDITWSEADPSKAKGFRYLLRQEAEAGYRAFLNGLRGFEDEFLIGLRIFARQRIAIVGLNSCRLHHRRDAGLGFVGLDQAEQAIRLLRQNSTYTRLEGNFLKIAVLHHHLLPETDLDLAELERPPAKRRFSLTMDASSVLNLLLADNFALVLHGHLHLPFCGVERRITVADTDYTVPGDSRIAVSAGGSLSVDKDHAERNQYQVIVVDDDKIEIHGVESLFTSPGRISIVTLNSEELTSPFVRAQLRPEWDTRIETQANIAAESLLLAEQILEQDPPAARDLLFQMLLPDCRRHPGLKVLELPDLTELFDDVLESWCGATDPLGRFKEHVHRDVITFPEFIFLLMVRGRGSV